jgi:hypothetical protein
MRRGWPPLMRDLDISPLAPILLRCRAPLHELAAAGATVARPHALRPCRKARLAGEFGWAARAQQQEFVAAVTSLLPAIGRRLWRTAATRALMSS